MSGTDEPIRVLHVDDEPDLSDMVATFLEREDDRITVQTATDGQLGEQKLAEEDVDCIVSDYDMPQMSGIEFLESVREDYPDLPFILYTGKGSEEVASDAISAGVTDYLQKEGGTDQYAILANRVVNAVQRYRAENEAAQTRKQLHAIAENTTDAIIIIDAESRIQFANPAVEAQFGYTASELQGQRLTTLMPQRYRDVHLTALERYLETGDRTMNWTNIEFPGLRKDGTEVPLSVSYGEFEQDGERRFIGVMRDISERTRMEAQLREREERFRQLAENIEEVVWMSDPNDEEIIYVNPTYEDVLGRSVESLYEDPSSFLDAVHPDDRSQVEKPLYRQRSDREDAEYRIVRPDGEVRYIRERTTTITNEAGEVTRIVGIASDVTKYTEQTRRLETLIGNLPGIVYRCRNRPNWPMEYVKGDCESLTGYSAAELESTEVSWGTDVLHPADQERIWETVQEELTADDAFEVTYRIRTAAGETRWMWERGQIVESEQDGEEVLEGFITDITEREEREDRLQKTTARLQALFEQSPDMINVHNEQGEIIDTNPHLCEETGYDEAELTGMNVWELDQSISPDEAQALWTGMEVGDRRELTGVYQRQDGSTFPVEVHVRRLDLDGEARFVVTSRNITDRRARERELERYEAIVENTDDGIYVINADGTFEFVNQRIADISGVPQDDWVGEHLSMLAELGTLTDGEVTEIEEAIELLVDGDTDEVSIEVEPDVSGDLGVIELRLTPFRAVGGTDHVIGFSRDVTERKRRERKLRQLQQRTEELVRASTRQEIADIAVATAHDVLELSLSGVHLADEDREVLEATAVTDEVQDHLGNAPAYERENPERSVETANWEIFEAGETVVIEDTRESDWSAESETPSRSGIIQPLGDHGLFITSSPNPHAFDEGDVALLDIFATTVTAVLDRNEREATLRNRTRRSEAQKDRLDKFASIVSHDLRNPLNVAEGRLELAREESDTEHLAHVDRALDRMNALIEDLLTLAREGETATDLEPLDFAAIAERCWTNVDTADATVTTRGSRTIQANESRLKQLFENLIRNAVEHGGENVTVTIGELDDGFYIEDDGPGIAESERSAIFDAGYSTNEAGTGFGLSIVKQIVDAHGWEITVSEGTDGGARFEITGVEFVTE